MAKITARVRDYSDEYSTTGVQIADLAGVDAFSVADAKADAFAGHVDAHSIGTVTLASFSQPTQAENDVRPANSFAQRELGIRFYYRDDVNGDIGFFTVPAADLSIGSIVAGQDELNLTVAPTAAFVTWIEAQVVSRAGNGVTVERAVIVGRSS